MNKLILVLLFSIFMVVVGFNTLDFMINTFAWSQPTNGYWHMSTFLVVDFWVAYVLFGVLPLTIGSILIGYTIGAIKYGCAS